MHSKYNDQFVGAIYNLVISRFTLFFNGGYIKNNNFNLITSSIDFMGQTSISVIHLGHTHFVCAYLLQPVF